MEERKSSLKQQTHLLEDLSKEELYEIYKDYNIVSVEELTYQQAKEILDKHNIHVLTFTTSSPTKYTSEIKKQTTIRKNVKGWFCISLGILGIDLLLIIISLIHTNSKEIEITALYNSGSYTAAERMANDLVSYQHKMATAENVFYLIAAVSFLLLAIYIVKNVVFKDEIQK